WWSVFLGRDTLIEMAGAQMLLLASLAVRGIAAAHGLDSRLSALAYSFTPAVVLPATACGSDLASGAFILAPYALVAGRAPRVLQAFPLFLGAGVKPTAIFAASGVLVYALRAKPKETLDRRAAVVLAVVGLSVGGYWYARNAVLKGNPV